MEFESVENNQDVETSDDPLYTQIENKAKLAQKSPPEYLFGKAIDILLEKGFEPSEIVQAFASEVSKRVDNPEVTIHLESAARLLVDYEVVFESNG